MSQMTTLRDLMENQARREPDAPALLAPGRDPLNYRQLLDHLDQTVSALRSFGIERGDRVAVVLPNGPEMAAAFLATASTACCAPLNPGYRTDEFDFYLSDLRAKALILAARDESPARDCARQHGIAILELEARDRAGLFELKGPTTSPADGGLSEPSDVALVLHTSGTTSRPKIVPLTYANLCASAAHIQASLELTSGDRCLNVMPLFHIHGLVGALLSSLSVGASVVCTPGFRTASFFEWLADFSPTWYSAVPTMHQAILSQAPHHGETIAGARLRFVRSCSAALPPQVMHNLERVLHVPVIEAYGMTEASHQMASNPLPPRNRKAGSVGIATGTTIAILDDSGNLLSAETAGEIAVRGPNITPGYENNPQANAAAFTGGWFRTGDQGYLDGDGYLFLTGRLKEIINRGGEKISPREVDEALIDHPAVEQALAFALPHPTLGEDIGAAVVLRPGSASSPNELRAFAARRLAGFKVPGTIVILNELPKGPTGKTQRVGLADKLGLTAPPPAATFVPLRSETEKRLAAIFGSLLHRDNVGLHDDFFALGGDSLQVVVLLAEIENALGRHITPGAFLSDPTISGLTLAFAQDDSGCIVSLQPSGTRIPLFCVPAAAGTPLLFQELAVRLAPGQPVYAFQSPGLDGKETPLATVEEMAARYIREIKVVRPRGPYSLFGYCLGGNVALEMAVRLQEEGEAVSLLGIAGLDRAGWFSDHWSRLVGRGSGRYLISRLTYHWSRLVGRGGGRYLISRLAYLWSRIRKSCTMLACRLWLARGFPLPPSLLPGYIEEINHHAGLSYQPRLFHGQIAYFQGDTDSAPDPRVFWSRYATGGAVLHRLPGPSSELLRSPGLVELLDRCCSA